MTAPLFDAAPTLPDGMRYTPDLVTAAEERALARRFAALPFRAFEFQGFLGKRRVVSFGWRYDFNLMKVEATEDMPAFLVGLRERAAAFAGLEPVALQQVLLTEYGPGAGIGWHKDRSVFGEAVGISLLAPCVSACAARRRKAAPGLAAPIADPRPALGLPPLRSRPQRLGALDPGGGEPALLGDVPEFAGEVRPRTAPPPN